VRSARVVLNAGRRELLGGEIRFENRVEMSSALRLDFIAMGLQFRSFLIIITTLMRITIIIII